LFSNENDLLYFLHQKPDSSKESHPSHLKTGWDADEDLDIDI
jgi:hypothetical protein